jgi:hypothetical protein
MPEFQPSDQEEGLSVDYDSEGDTQVSTYSGNPSHDSCALNDTVKQCTVSKPRYVHDEHLSDDSSSADSCDLQSDQGGYEYQDDSSDMDGPENLDSISSQ